MFACFVHNKCIQRNTSHIISSLSTTLHPTLFLYSPSSGVVINTTESPLTNIISDSLSRDFNSPFSSSSCIVSVASLRTILQCESKACSVPTSDLAPRSLTKTRSSRFSLSSSNGALDIRLRKKGETGECVQWIYLIVVSNLFCFDFDSLYLFNDCL